MALDTSDSQMDVVDGPRQDKQVQDLINSHLSRISDVSAHSTSSSIRNALELLDDEMNTLQNVLASVATRRNAISQNARLPPEILSRIFQSTADLHRATDPDAYPNVGQRRAWAGWLEVLHVCRRWREVALQDLTLWTELTYTTSLPWLEQILDWVQGAPVTLHRHIINHTKRQFEIINNHLSHIRELVIILDHETAYFELCHALTPASLSNPAPILESLTFATRCDGVSLDSEWEEELVIPLPETFFAGEVPALRRISLRSFRLQSIVSSHFIKDSITHFELRYPRKPLYETPGDEFEPPERNNLLEPRRAELLACLRRLPALEVLRLADCFPRVTVDSWSSGADVHLGHLRHLELKGDDGDCAGFLERVTIPPSASLRMVSSVARPESEDATMPLFTVPVILAYVESVSSAYRITALAFQLSNYNPSLRMHMWRAPSGTGPAAEETVPFLAIDFTSSFASFDTLCLPLLTSLCAGLRLPDLRVLGVFSATMMRIRSTWNGACFAQLFSRFAGIEHLVVNPRTAVLIPAAIAEPGGLFDRLTTLSVVSGPAGTPAPRPDERAYMQQLLEPLQEMKRKKRFAPTVCVHMSDGAAWQLGDGDEGIVAVRAHPADGRKYLCRSSPV